MSEDAAERIWQKLVEYHRQSRSKSLNDLFATDTDRFERFSVRLDDLLLDFSKTSLTKPILDCLFALARACDVERQRDAMFKGEPINLTENRAVLHIALRNRVNRPIYVDNLDVMPEVNEVLFRLGVFAERVRSRAIKSAEGHKFTDVIQIGIGGSELGPEMTVQALAPFHDGPRLHFVSNVDGAHLADTIKTLDPASTLVIIASKTFTTVETMLNACSARRWIAEALGEEAVAAQFVAISTAVRRAAEFGIASDRIFGFWDWVGGRYSIWSAIGLPLMIAIGEARFREFLAGAHSMDEHFRLAPLSKNLPILFGLVGIWHRRLCGYTSRAILPYDQRLHRLPAYLQQLDMESNGKSVTRSGAAVTRPTGPIIWGEPGTNGQHAFYQLLHQGTEVVPCEFIIAAQGHEPDLVDHHRLLVANCFAQSEALMKGRNLAAVEAALLAQGMDKAKVRALAPHKVFPGSRPSLTIVYAKLDPFALGRLIALYEHRIFVEAAILNINAFDQWGVELGKELATELLPIIAGDQSATAKDGSTQGLVAHLRQYWPT